MTHDRVTGKTVVVVSSAWSSFVEADAGLLSKAYEVEKVAWRSRYSYPKLKAAVRRTRAVLSWFAGDHAVAAALLAHRWRKPMILISGGADVANMPEIRYGAMAGSLKSRLATRWSLRLSDLVLPFSEFSKEEIREIHTPRRIEVLPLGVDVDRFSPAGKKEQVVATVGFISETNLLRKGHLTFVKAAALLPEAQFVLAGEPQDDAVEVLKKGVPANVEFPGRMSDQDLLGLYRRAKVYVQVSAHEGFGLAVAESMATECVPVVTRRGSLPEVVGDTGRYVDFQNATATAEAIRQVLTLPDAAGATARQRVIERFTIQRRAARLINLLDDMIAGHAA